MKNAYLQKAICLFGTCLIVPATLQAQSTTTIYTPKGTAVTGTTYPELSGSQKEAINQEADNNYPQAQKLTEPTRTYNCHAYAWYLSEFPSDTKYWLENPNDDIYWTDGSFIEICNASEASKISYVYGDHSAIRSNVASKYDSKWGAWPLMRHDPTYSPYTSSLLKYYVSTKITTPYSTTTVSCNTPFSVASFTGGTYSWTSSSNITLNTTSGAAVQASANGNGSGWLEVRITSPCSGAVATRRIDVFVENLPSGRITYNTTNNTLQGTNFVAWSYIQVFLDGPYNFTFSATSRSTGAPISLNGTSGNHTGFTMPNTERSGVNVTITSTNAPCRLGGTFFFIPTGPPPGSYYAASPNPASSDLTVTEASDESTAATAPSGSLFEAELYDFNGKKVKTQKSERGKAILNIVDLPNGLYNLRVGAGEKPSTQLIQITH